MASDSAFDEAELSCENTAHATVEDTEAAAQAQCVICMGSIYDTAEGTQLLSCGHLFHAGCVADMMQQLGIQSLDDVRCPECRRTPSEVNAQTICMVHNDQARGSVVVIPEDTQPDGQPDEHEQSVLAGQPEASEAKR